MKNNNEIKTLPSKVILSNGSIVTLDELKEKERAEIQSCMCKNISNQISNYYSTKLEEWKNFVLVMTWFSLLYLFGVWTTILTNNNFRKFRIWIFYIYRIFKFLLINPHLFALHTCIVPRPRIRYPFPRTTVFVFHA